MLLFSTLPASAPPRPPPPPPCSPGRPRLPAAALHCPAGRPGPLCAALLPLGTHPGGRARRRGGAAHRRHSRRQQRDGRDCAADGGHVAAGATLLGCPCVCKAGLLRLMNDSVQLRSSVRNAMPAASRAVHRRPPSSHRPPPLFVARFPALQKCRDAGQMPVHAAAHEGRLEVLQYLYGAGFNMTGGFLLDSELVFPLPNLVCLLSLLPVWPSPPTHPPVTYPCHHQSLIRSTSRRCTTPPSAAARLR